MSDRPDPQTAPALLPVSALSELITVLTAAGYEVIGPQISDGAIVYEPLESAADLPQGWIDEQAGGHYRLQRNTRPALFDYVVGPHSWKRYLFPPRQRLWRAERNEQGFQINTDQPTSPRYAFIGVRSCEIQAMQIQDRVFNNGHFADPGYQARRENAFIVAVNCARPGGTCFCVSMDSGPKARQGFDLALTEILDDERHVFMVETGSDRGRDILAQLALTPADMTDINAASAVTQNAVKNMQKAMPDGVEALLKRNLEHPQWEAVAQRCLSCGNCTMVCPTCFCTTVEDSTDLSATVAERWRQWDSCFSVDFSYIHGGSIRREGYSRYRQWMTHKLAHWHDQFDSSGCVGCGRCVTWCPVGIDITEEARAIQDSENEAST